MTRNAVRNWCVVCCFVSLSLVHLLWPTQASQPVALDANPLDAYVARNIGPAKMGGRTVAIAGVDDQPNIVYVGTASGGVWKTTNGGDSWMPIFDHESTVSVGDVAVCQSNPNIVWVGTGEHNPRNSVAWGDGVYKSVDGGKIWQHMGLRDTHSIGRIVIHPKQPDIVYVAAMGHTWGPNKERGIFKTTDGGKTWEVSKFWDENTGAIELKMDPTDPNILYASAWQVRRDAFSGGEPITVFGPHAGLYKTTDGGKNWDKMTNGLPTVQVGRSGIDIYRKDPNVLYAIVNAKGKGGGGKGGGGGGGGKGGGKGGGDKNPVGTAGAGDPNAGGTYRSDDKGKTWKNLNTNVPRPMYFSQIRVDPKNDQRIYVLGVTMFISDDGGKTFFSHFTSGLGNPLNSPHADHHALWINPKNPDEMFEGDDGGIWHSKDKAKTFQQFVSMPLGQYYGISCDMRKPYWVFGGCQDNGGFGTPSATYDPAGIRNNLVVYISGGDGFHTQNDPTDHNIVYTESQNGNVQRVDLSKKGKGKGGIIDIDDDEDKPLDGQDQKKDEQKKDEQKKDEPKKGDPQKGGGKGGGGGGGGFGGKGGGIKPAGNNRWNWSTPMLLSPHDPWTYFCGSQFLYMSKERGNNPKAISPDLTYGPGAKDFAYDGPAKQNGQAIKDEPAKDAQDKKDDQAKKDEEKKGGKGGGGGMGGGGGGGGGGAHSLFTIGESPKKRGLIWTGSDDGRIMLTKDFGVTWTDQSVIAGFPKDRCISRVEPSHYADGTCYVSIMRYRNDDRKPYIFKTTDYGKTWENITGNLPENGSVHVVIESSRNKQLLFSGTEFGLFASLNGGKSWYPMKGGMPTVAVHDLVIHPRDRDLVVGTHGRSIFIFDDIGPLEQMTPENLAKPAHLFDIRPATAFKWKKTGPDPKSNEFTGQNPSYGAIIRYYLNSVPAQAVSISILDAGTGKQVASLAGSAKGGLNEVLWNLRGTGQTDATVPPGDYLTVLQTGDHKQYKMLRVDAE